MELPSPTRQTRRDRCLAEATSFASLPDDALVPQFAVEGVFRISPTTVWRMCRDGRLPKPVKLNARAARWRVGDLRKALAAIAG